MSLEEALDNDTRSEGEFTAQIRADLNTAGGWAQFLAIVGFIGIAFMALAGLMLGAMGGSAPEASPMMRGMDTSVVGLIYIVMAVVYLIPMIWLYKFSVNSRNAAKSTSMSDLGTAVNYLRRHFQFMGIFTIVIISLYFLLIFAAVAAT